MIKSRILSVFNTKTVVEVTDDDQKFNNTGLATFEGLYHKDLAKAFVRVVNVRCSECGRFGGEHNEYFVKTGQNNGEVDGYYRQCSNKATMLIAVAPQESDR